MERHRSAPIAVKAVSTPRDSEIGGFGGNGPWPIAELAFSADGSRLVAVDYPQIAGGDSSLREPRPCSMRAPGV